MKLFFDPIKMQENEPELDKCVAADLRLDDILHGLISDKEIETAAKKVLMQFCRDESIIDYRQQIVYDLIGNDGVFRLFSDLRDGLVQLNELYQMNMFRQIPETRALKTFLITEKFTRIYSRLLAKAEDTDTSELSPAFSQIITDIRDAGRKAELDRMEKDVIAMREGLKKLESVRFNRFFSRGQNIENSIMPATEEPSLTKHISDLAAGLGLDVNEANVCALQVSRELTRPVFLALHEEYKDVFDGIERFHSEYEKTFDGEWLDLIPKLSAVIAFALIFRKLKASGFPVTKGKTAVSTEIEGLYSLALASKGATPGQVVCNDLNTTPDRKFFFIMGPNAGGKTVFLSALAMCRLMFQGCGIVPAKSAKIRIVRRLFTHFPVEEYNDESGRLVEEQNRVDKIFAAVGNGDCAAFFNETYSSTKADVAYRLSSELCENVRKHDVEGLFVTHLHSLKDYATSTEQQAPHIGILTAAKDGRTGQRTYRIVPMTSQNSSFAEDILEKYGMTAAQMFQRLKLKKEGR